MSIVTAIMLVLIGIFFGVIGLTALACYLIQQDQAKCKTCENRRREETAEGAFWQELMAIANATKEYK